MLNAIRSAISWELTFFGLLLLYLAHRTYGLYVARLKVKKEQAEEQKRNAEDIASLHLRTVEALALAIEAKEHRPGERVDRVQTYAVEIGKELGLPAAELEALGAAALLLDIGKLAVPDHITSKPGKLTPEEFERMKIHPVVGAKILDHVEFPYPVAPIVRAHHEKWDGTGYPDGLRGDAIPLAARILTVVDSVNAIASERQYRRALPLDESVKLVVSEAGRAFDPRVCEVLQRRYVELEAMAQSRQVEKTRLSKDLKIENGQAPAAGFEKSNGTPAGAATPDFFQSIVAARQEVQMLFEMSQDLGNSLSLNETLSVLAAKLKRVIPYDAIAIYVLRDKTLFPEFVSGDDFRLLSSLEIPLGEGLSGWVAENRKTILNGNPAVESAYLGDAAPTSAMQSALALPLEGLNGVLGVLSLYQEGKDAFSQDHLRFLMALISKISHAVENALKYRQAEASATTDALTGLPNRRSLFQHLDGEMARCRRSRIPLSLLACNLDGFKQVNERFGRAQGDKVLQAVAHRFRESCREYDYIARMGGDGFIVVLPGFDPRSLDGKMAQLAQLAHEAGQEICGEKIGLLSVGFACFEQDGTDADHLLSEADGRMRRQKQEHKFGMGERATLDLAVLSSRLQ